MFVSHLSRFLAALCAALLFAPTPGHAQQLKLKPLDWPNDTQLQFGIYNARNERYATAYYRILKETVKGETLYHFKYLGRNEAMSESAEVWVDPQTLLPLRSTRKVVGRTKTLFVDCAYQDKQIIVRQKYEGQPVTELIVPISGKFFDFEALYWLIPQIDWSGGNFTSINYFNTFKFQMETTIITREGADKVTVKDKSFPATRYRFAVGATKYTFWTVDQGGRQVPARIFMDDLDDRADITFVNLGLDPKKVKAGGVTAAPVPGADPAPAQPAPPAIPLPPPPPVEDEQPDAPAPPDDENPLVPPTPGGRFK